MARTQIQEGNFLDYTTTGDVASGDVVVMQDTLGIAQTGAKGAGNVISVAMTGVHQLPKAAGAALAQGKKVYWDATAKTVVTTATSNVQLGYVATAAASADTVVNVRLWPN